MGRRDQVSATQALDPDRSVGLSPVNSATNMSRWF